MLKFVDTKVVFREVPNEISLAINISGCPCHCDGCHSKYLADDIGTQLSDMELRKLITANPGISCVAFMGGDSDPDRVAELLSVVKQTAPELKTCWYSGREFGASYHIKHNLDYLKTGPFIPLRGPLDSPNTNQRFYEIKWDEDNLHYGLFDKTDLFNGQRD